VVLLIGGLVLAVAPYALALPHAATASVPTLLGWDYAPVQRSADLLLDGRLPPGPPILSPEGRGRYRNLGPAESLELAPFVWAADHDVRGIFVGLVLLGAAWSAAIVLCVPRAGAIGAGAALFLVGRRFGITVDPWNPTMTVLPLAAALAGVSACRRGRWWASIVVALGASVAAQGHLATLPVIAVAFVALAFAAWQQRHRFAAWRLPALVGVVVLVLAWVPVMMLVSSGNPGNVADLVSETVHPTGPTLHDPNYGSVAASVVLRRSVTLAGLGETNGADRLGAIQKVQQFEHRLRDWSVGSLVVSLAVIAVFALCAARWSDLRGDGVVLGVSMVVMVAVAILDRGSYQDYFLAPVASISIAAVASWSAAAAPRLWRAVRSRTGSPATAATALASIGVVALIVAGLVWRPSEVAAPLRTSRLNDRAPALAVAREVGARTGCRDVVLDLAGDFPIPEAWALLTALERTGHEVRAPDRRTAVILGTRVATGSRPRAGVRIGAPADESHARIGSVGSFDVTVDGARC
jgi:hypothetical protein